MNQLKEEKLVSLDTELPIWSHFYTVAPLVVIGTKENKGYDLAPKHMATPLGRDNYFGFVCTPKHGTYQNIKKEKVFTVSFPRPDQVVLTSLAASPRCGIDHKTKAIVDGLPTFKSENIDALFVKNSYLYLECELTKIIDGFGEFSLIAGKITGAFVNNDSLRISDGDDQKMIYQAPMLAYLPYGRFAEIKNTLVFPIPQGME
jgi:flavin reductase (DIM6/NTAB) family NADH-FMN oxidoreductase RutF